MPDTKWHDINSPRPLPEPNKPEKKSGSSATSTDDSKPKEKPPVEYRFKSVRPIEPAQGFEKNKPFDIEGEIEKIAEKITRPRVLLFPVGLYKSKEDKFVPGGIEAAIDAATLKFRGTCKYLFDPESFAEDKQKPADATWDLIIRAEGNTAEKSLESDKLTFPKPSKFVELKRGHYDKHGA